MSKSLEQTKKLQEESQPDKYLNVLVYGPTGSGKTHLISTCPKPILIDFFDPGGHNTATVKHLIENDPDVYADTRWEREEPQSPHVYKSWVEVMNQRYKDGTFDEISTYVIDSVTTWSDAVMNQVLKDSGRKGGVPQRQDYQPQMNKIRDDIIRITSVPCHTLFLGHVNSDTDDVTGKAYASVQMVGKNKIKVPLLCDEIWVAQSKVTSKGIEYSLLTQNDGFYIARSRISDNRFDLYEKPDISYLLEKAGFETPNNNKE